MPLAEPKPVLIPILGAIAIFLVFGAIVWILFRGFQWIARRSLRGSIWAWSSTTVFCRAMSC